MNLPNEYLSISQVEMFLRCPKQYEFRYVNGIVRPPSVALVEGGSHHVALETNNTQKMDTHDDLPASNIFDVFESSFTDKSKEVEDWEEESRDSVLSRGKALIDEYMTAVAPEIQPDKVEQRFDLTLDVDGCPVSVVGYIDLVQGDLLSDYKVVGKTKTQSDVDNSLQLAVYGVATEAKEAENICLVKTKQPKIARVKTVLSPSGGDWAAEVISGVAKAISAGSFHPCAPDSWCCTQRFCGYYSLCRGKNK